jgi:hypothetical protein
MTSYYWRRLTGVACVLVPAWLSAAPLDTNQLERLTGLKGTLNTPEGVFKVTAPRTDLKIAVDGWNLPPFMGLTTWAAFMEGKQAEAMVMGDLVVFQDEVNSVMSALFANGIDVTALHNHFFFDEPKAYFMHIAGEGSWEKLATGVKAALAKQKEIRDANPTPAKQFGNGFAPVKNAISEAPLERVFGAKAQAKDGMAKFVFGRPAKMACGCEVNKEMGLNTWAAFAGTDDNAVVDGDFAVTETELQTVLRTLRAEDINIVAIHHHMTQETPRYLFLHYWGKGSAPSLAGSLKKALDAQKAVK